MSSLGSDPSTIAKTVEEINRMAVHDYKGEVMSHVQPFVESKYRQEKLGQTLQLIRDQLKDYEGESSRGKFVQLLKDHSVYDSSIEPHLDKLDLFIKENISRRK